MIKIIKLNHGFYLYLVNTIYGVNDSKHNYIYKYIAMRSNYIILDYNFIRTYVYLMQCNSCLVTSYDIMNSYN